MDINGHGLTNVLFLNGSGMGSGVILQEWDRMGFIFLLRPRIGMGWDIFSGSGMGQE